MYKKTISYTDYNGTPREEDFYFNFSKAELAEMELSTTGGMLEKAKKIIKAQNTPELVKLFKDLVLDAYGEKSEDGRRFIKSEELKTAFAQTEAYSVMFMELATNDKAAAEFMNMVIPSDIAKQVDASKIEKTILTGQMDQLN